MTSTTSLRERLSPRLLVSQYLYMSSGKHAAPDSTAARAIVSASANRAPWRFPVAARARSTHLFWSR